MQHRSSGGTAPNRTRAAKRLSSPLGQLGPGLITGAADDDPSGIATYSQAGAQFGFNLLWTLLLTFPLMVAIQMISALIGRVTGQGLARNMAAVMPRPLVTILVALLFLANTINVGADLAAMGEAARLVTGLNPHLFTIGFALLSLGLQLFIPYRRYARLLTVLTFSLFAYVALLFLLKLNWGAIGAGLIGLHPALSAAAATTIVAIFGTTISPYLFFWQSAQEVEEVDQHPDEKPLLAAPRQAPQALRRIQIDTLAGMFVSNAIAIAIIISTAATLNAHGVTNVATAADAAKALEPVAGRFAFALFALGIVGTGLLAVPVLAGSAAYAIGEGLRWPTGLSRRPKEAKAFYATLAAATAIGIILNFSPIDPIKALYWSAVINGVVAVPVMVILMMMTARPKIMGEFTVTGWLRWLGWASTAAMALCVAGMVAGWFA